MAYEYETTKESSPSDLAVARQTNPGMSEQELIENYGHCDLEESLEMRFAGGLLIEIEASWIAGD